MGNPCPLVKFILIISVSVWLSACGSGGGSKSPDDVVDSGNTGVSKTVTAGVVLELAVNGAVVSIPADALEPGVVVTLTEVDPASLDELPNGVGESLITPVYALEFSNAQPSLGLIRFALDIPASVLTGSYARIKVKGGLDAEGETDTDWLAELGEHDAPQSLLVLNLYATATRLLVAGLSSSPAAASGPATGSITRAASRPQLMVERLAATAAAKLLATNMFHIWNNYGWVLLCEPKQFKKFKVTSCDPESPEFLPMMNRLAPKLYAADKRLTSLGFPLGSVHRVTLEGILNDGFPYVVYDPDGRSVARSSSTGNKLAYAIAWVDPDTTDNILGLFYPSTSRVQFDIDTGDNGTVIHELMHAVQRAEIHNMYGGSNNWILEGIAEATVPYSTGYSGPSPRDYRFGSWRDWKNSLLSNDDQNHYKSEEFWLSLTGDLSSIPSFYDNLRGDSSSTETNSQLQVDAALTATGLPSLDQAYTDLILQRDGQAGYLHCAGEGEAVVRLCSGASCTTLVEDLHPVSAQCLFETISFASCDDQPVAMTVTLEPDSPNPNMKLIVDGVLYAANTPVDFPVNGKRVWVVNTDLEPLNSLPEPGTSSPGPTAKLVYKNESPTCDIGILMQQINANAYADANTSGSPSRSLSAETYTSYDDLRQDSVLSTVSNSGTVNVTVAPLGFDAWESTQSVSASAGDAASAASAYVSTEIISDATSMTTSGHQVATASFSGEKPYAAASSSNIYEFEVKNVPAELTLAWGCDLSNVVVSNIGSPAGYQSLLQINNSLYPEQNNWECEPRSWMIQPGTRTTIKFFTHFDAYQPHPSLPNAYQNGGGAFEIILQSVPPEGG